MAWTYILECADGSFYVGSTVNLEARLWQHNEGVGANYTRPRRRRPVKVAWAGEFARIDEAFAFEKRVQGWSRKKRIALIELSARRTRSTFTQWEAEQSDQRALDDG
jgi:putative endonuclease